MTNVIQFPGKQPTIVQPEIEYIYKVLSNFKVALDRDIVLDIVDDKHITIINKPAGTTLAMDSVTIMELGLAGLLAIANAKIAILAGALFDKEVDFLALLSNEALEEQIRTTSDEL